MTGTGAKLDQREIASLIPHAGAMCLLDAVTDWSETHIECRARSHRDPGHPLRVKDRLPIWCAIEYGAQAMAVHGGLLARAAGTRVAPGFLAAVRDVVVQGDRLDTIAGELVVRATRLAGDARSLLYEFTVDEGLRRLAQGRAMVMLNPSGALS